MGRKRKPKASEDAQPTAKKLKIEAKEEPIEENEDEKIEDEKPKTRYVRAPRIIDGDPNSNLVCKKFLSAFREMIAGNPDIKLEELEKITCGSARILNWKCLVHETCQDHVWEAAVCNRLKGVGCPYCATGTRKKECLCKIPAFKNPDGSYKPNQEHMKRCAKCRVDKPKWEFCVAKNNNDGYNWCCKECANKTHFEDHALNSAIMRCYLQGKCCQDCGSTNDVVFEFDHVNNDKATTKNGKPKAKLSLSPHDLCLEIKKTEIVCIRCHRIRTFAGKRNRDSKKSAKKRELAVKLKLERQCCSHCPRKITKDTMHLFDCDHIDPETKIESVSQMIKQKKYTLKNLEDEIKKCQLLCCCCHRAKTAKDEGWRKLSDYSDEVIKKARTFLDQHFKKDREGNYIHVRPVKVEVPKIQEKPKKPREVPISKNVKALMASFANRKIDLNPSI